MLLRNWVNLTCIALYIKTKLRGSDLIATVVSIYGNENLLTSESIVGRSFQICNFKTSRSRGGGEDKAMFSLYRV